MLLAIGAAGVLVLVLGAAIGQTIAIAVGMVILGGGYALHLVLDEPALDARAALVAAGLLLAAELGCWSIELRSEVTREPGRHLRRLTAEVALCLGGLLVSALVLAAADLGHVRGVAVELAGAVAAIGVVWLALSALRRPS